MSNLVTNYPSPHHSSTHITHHSSLITHEPSLIISDRTSGSTLPPESTTPTRLQSFGILQVNTAAAAAAPDGSISSFIQNSMNRMVAMISLSLTVKRSSRPCDSCCIG